MKTQKALTLVLAKWDWEEEEVVVEREFIMGILLRVSGVHRVPGDEQKR